MFKVTADVKERSPKRYSKNKKNATRKDNVKGKGTVHVVPKGGMLRKNNKELLCCCFDFRLLKMQLFFVESLKFLGGLTHLAGSGFGPFTLLFCQIHVRHVHTHHQRGVRVTAQAWLVVTAG